MTTNPQKRSVWSIVGVVALTVIGVLAVIVIMNTYFGSDDAGPPVTLPTAVPGAPVATALEPVNVRSGPGTEYPIYGVAAGGDSAEVVGISTDGLWWVVRLPVELVGQGQGWVYSEYVEVTGEEDFPVIPSPERPPSLVVPTPGPGVPAATAIEAINLRSGPGTQYSSYGVAPKGAKGEVIGVSADGGWWVVKLPTSLVPEGQVWVSDDWVTTTDTESVPVIPPPA
jgi:uncharacterized protein YraI